MRNVSDKMCRENKNKIVFNKFCSANRVFYEITWKGIAEPGRPQMRFSCWMTKAINTHAKYIIFLSFAHAPQCYVDRCISGLVLNCLVLVLWRSSSFCTVEIVLWFMKFIPKNVK